MTQRPIRFEPGTHQSVGTGELVSSDNAGGLSINLQNPRPIQDPLGAQDSIPRDWMLANSNWIRTVGRVGNLPDTTDPLNPIRFGSTYLITKDFSGNEYNRLTVWTPDGWEFVNTKNWTKKLVSDTLQNTDQQEGDLSSTTENAAKELWTYSEGAWQLLFGETEIKGWIASLALFSGVVHEVGNPAPNIQDFSILPDITATANPSLTGHYWTYTGTANYTVKATDPIIASSLTGTILNPGDWIQVSTDPLTGTQKYVTVGGDLLSKSRGDNLFGLNPWTNGSWEQGATVSYDDKIYKANQSVIAGNLAPGVVPTAGAVAPADVSPWTLVPLSGGLRWVTDDTSLPTNAKEGEVWFVLSSARAGSAGALYYFDTAKGAVDANGIPAGSWEPLTGGGLALALTGGTVIYERPLVWDEVTAKPDGKYDGDLLYYPVSKRQIDRWDDLNQQWNPVLQGSSTESPTEIFPPAGTITEANYASGLGNGGWLESSLYCSVNYVRPYLSFKLATPGVTSTAYKLYGNLLVNGSVNNIYNSANRGNSVNPNTMVFNSSSGWGGLNMAWMDNANYVKDDEVLFIRTRWHRVSDSANLSWFWALTTFSYRRADGNLMSYNVTTRVAEDATTKIAQISHVPLNGNQARSISIIKSH